MSATYLPVAGHVVTHAARQRIRVGSVVFQFGERFPSPRRVRLVVFVPLLSGMRFLHANETRLFETTETVKTVQCKLRSSYRTDFSVTPFLSDAFYRICRRAVFPFETSFSPISNRIGQLRREREVNYSARYDSRDQRPRNYS